MAELLHYSRAGVQGPMLAAPTAVHPGVAPREPAFPAGAWLPTSPNPREGLALDAGVRHKQAEAYAGAAAAAAEALGDEMIGRKPPRTPAGVAAPYQKPAAQRAAERAIRPWDPASGLGEARGARLLQVEGSNAGAGAYARPGAPALYEPPSAAAVDAVAAAAGRVARAGQGQVTAHGAYSVQQGAQEREIWPVELKDKPPRYCTGCRGSHEPSRERDPAWQPYTPHTRLANLQQLDTKFSRAMFKGVLCCSLSESYWDPVRWTTQPIAMDPATFRQQLRLTFDGIREGHEPYRFLATRAAEALLSCPGRGPQVAAAVPDLVAPLKLCLNTLQPELVGGLLLLLAKLLRCHPAVPPAMAPFLRHLLPPLALFRGHNRLRLELPSPVCVASTGTFSGRGVPPEAGGRSCRVCRAPVDRVLDAAAARAAAAEALARNAAALGAQAAADPESALPPPTGKRLPGRVCGRYTLSELVEEVAGLLAAGGGDVARRLIRSYLPAFGYVSQQEQSRCRVVEEELQAAAEGGGGARRPRSASRRPASAGKPRRRSRTKSVDGAGGSHGGGGGDGDVGSSRPAWSSTVLTREDLARWDGMEFRDESYDKPRRGAESYDIAGGGGGGGGAGGPVLSVLTPVPVFDTPHDPLYRKLMEGACVRKEAARRSVTFAHVRPDEVRKGGGGAQRRGGAGGAGGRPASANVEVPYRASRASQHRGF
ncbi:hypothetical protein GPECTOR_42g812 [Gonium pectorale]|uniref:Uncharacterized protein n=1 Tax=Gonium pectorale TaxID=33097 RepID=A0A150G9U1_GONPE|nr:hypothetical protein GPECTOR_42g812 [Gonium pectorale]|eukprot:KXZ46601.1 hypothetical protein GPECTOR_42g812 [Gonium pectorale]